MLHEKAGYDYKELPQLTEAEVNRLVEGMRVSGKRKEYERRVEQRKSEMGDVGGQSSPEMAQHKRRMAENQDAHIQRVLQEKARKN